MPSLILLKFTTSQCYTSTLNKDASTPHPMGMHYCVSKMLTQIGVHAFESSKYLLEYPGAVTTYHHQMVFSSSIICGNFIWGFCGLSVASSSVAKMFVAFAICTDCLRKEWFVLQGLLLV